MSDKIDKGGQFPGGADGPGRCRDPDKIYVASYPEAAAVATNTRGYTG